MLKKMFEQFSVIPVRRLIKFGIKVYYANYIKLVSREIYYCGSKIT